MTEITKARIRIFKRNIKRLGEKVSDTLPTLVVFGLVAFCFGCLVVFGIVLAENTHDIPLERRIIN